MRLWSRHHLGLDASAMQVVALLKRITATVGTGLWLSRRVGVEITRLLRLVHALPGVEQADSTRYSTFVVHGAKFGYLWPRTGTVGLKQTLSEQLALVAERPDVFEVQFTSGGFGWVVVYLTKIDVDELSELVLEAWRLSAPDRLLVEAPTPAALVEA